VDGFDGLGITVLSIGNLAAGPREATKTDAGERVVPMLPALSEDLMSHRLDYPGAPWAPAFRTRNGTPQWPDNRAPGSSCG
jgi:hypothetical protein